MTRPPAIWPPATGPDAASSAEPFHRADGARFCAADLDECVPVHRGELDEIAYLITLLEDWLLHTDDLVLADLARFAHDRRPADLIDDLGTQSVKLHRLIRAIT
jgi:hypothetical protein